MAARTRNWVPGVVLLVLAAWASQDGLRTLATLLVAPAVLLGVRAYRGWRLPTRAAYAALLGLSFAWFATMIGVTIRRNLRVIPEWDFLGFWLHAKTAVAGGNFYDPRSLAGWHGTFDFSWQFRKEIVNVGFWYPPPTMFLFWPLGLFEPGTALALWYLFHGAILGAAVVLLRRRFFPDGGAVELAACATLAATSHGTFLTFEYGQTNFVALLALLLFWGRRERAGGGAWAAVALFVKPFLAVLAVALVAETRWRALLGFLTAVLVLSLAAVVAFGPATFAGYVASDQVGAKPGWIYSERTNQSLLGWMLRVTGAECVGEKCVTFPPYLAVAALLGLVTLALAWRLARAGDAEWALALLLTYALMAYPVSQLFYSVLLLPVLLLAWRERERIAGGAPAVAVGAGAIHALTAVDDGLQALPAFAVSWLALAWIGATRIREGQGRGSLSNLPSV